jgi:hypothetical protein
MSKDFVQYWYVCAAKIKERMVWDDRQLKFEGSRNFEQKVIVATGGLKSINFIIQSQIFQAVPIPSANGKRHTVYFHGIGRVTVNFTDGYDK